MNCTSACGPGPGDRRGGDALRRARSGLKDPKRPIGQLYLPGFQRRGQDRAGQALAEYLFDDDDALVRIDMSEYRSGIPVSRLSERRPAMWL